MARHLDEKDLKRRALARKPAGDPLLGLSGDIDSLPADLSASFRRYLDETFVAPAPYRGSRRPARPGSFRRRAPRIR
jgi:hypothetical protein